MRLDSCQIALCDVCGIVALCVPSRKRAPFGDGEVFAGWGAPAGWTTVNRRDVCSIIDPEHDQIRRTQLK